MLWPVPEDSLAKSRGPKYVFKDSGVYLHSRRAGADPIAYIRRQRDRQLALLRDSGLASDRRGAFRRLGMTTETTHDFGPVTTDAAAADAQPRTPHERSAIESPSASGGARLLAPSPLPPPASLLPPRPPRRPRLELTQRAAHAEREASASRLRSPLGSSSVPMSASGEPFRRSPTRSPRRAPFSTSRSRHPRPVLPLRAGEPAPNPWLAAVLSGRLCEPAAELLATGFARALACCLSHPSEAGSEGGRGKDEHATSTQKPTAATPATRAIPALITAPITAPASARSAIKERELREEFARLDEDASGFISVDELATALSAGTRMTKEQARSLAKGVVAKYDADGNGELDLEEFIAYSTRSPLPKRALTVAPSSKAEGDATASPRSKPVMQDWQRPLTFPV